VKKNAVQAGMLHLFSKPLLYKNIYYMLNKWFFEDKDVDLLDEFDSMVSEF